MKACLFAIDIVLRADRAAAAGDGLGHDLRQSGRTLSGQPVEAFWYSVSHFDMLSAWASTAPRGRRQMRPHVEALAAIAHVLM